MSLIQENHIKVGDAQVSHSVRDTPSQLSGSL